MAYAQPRFRKYLDVQLSFLVLIQSVELRFHKHHPLFCSEILPLSSVSIGSSNCLTSFSPSASLACRFGTAALTKRRPSIILLPNMFSGNLKPGIGRRSACVDGSLQKNFFQIA